MLSAKLLSHLPAEARESGIIDPGACTELLSLKSSPKGSYGETHLIAHERARTSGGPDGADDAERDAGGDGSELFLLTRSSAIDGFELVKLASGVQPTLEGKGWKAALRVHTEDGETHELKLSEDERTSALRMLEARYLACGAWGPLVELMRRRVDEQTGNEQLDGLLAMGDVYLERLGSLDEAYACFSEVLSHPSREDRAIEGMARILAAVEDAPDEMSALVATVVAVLQAHYRRHHHAEKLAWVLTVVAPTLETHEERAAAYVEAATLTSTMEGRTEAALALAGRALAETPGDAAVLELVDDLARRSAAWALARAAWEKALADERVRAEPTLGQAFLARITRASVDRLADWERGESAAYALLELDQTDALGWRALDTIYTATERWSELVDVLEERVGVEADRHARVALRFRAAEILRERLSDVDRACVMYEAVLALSSDHDPSYEKLEAIHRRRGDHEALRQLLERWAAAQSEPSRRADITVALAEVCEVLERPVDAIAAWRRVLANRPGDRACYENLVRLYRVTKNWLSAVATLREWARASRPDSLPLYLEAAAVARTQLGDQAKALDIFLQADGEHPGERRVLDEIRALASELGRLAELEQALRALLELDGLSADERVGYLVELALLMERVGRDSDALDIWRQVLDADPSHAQALDHLHALYRKKMRWSDVVTIVEKKLERGNPPATSVELLLELADIHRLRLDDTSSAVPALEAALELDPSLDDVASTLADCLTELRRWRPLAELHRERGARAQDDMDARASHLIAAARVMEERLSEPQRGLELLLEWLPESWRADALADEIARLARATKEERKTIESMAEYLPRFSGDDRRDYVAFMDRVIAHFERHGHDEGLLLFIGRHFEEVRFDPAGAAERYRQIGSSTHEVAANRRLRVVLRDMRAWRELAELLERMAVDEKFKSGERRGIYRELADIYALHLSKPKRAVELRQRSKSAAPVLLVLVIALLGAAIPVVYLLTSG